MGDCRSTFTCITNTIDSVNLCICCDKPSEDTGLWQLPNIYILSLQTAVSLHKQSVTFSRRRSEHTDRKVELKPTVLFRTTPTQLEVFIACCYRKAYFNVLPPCKVSNLTISIILFLILFSCLQDERQEFEELIYYYKYAAAAYGWPGYAMFHPTKGCCHLIGRCSWVKFYLFLLHGNWRLENH